MELVEREALLVLKHVPGIGLARLHLLLRRFGSALPVLQASPNEIRDRTGLSEKLAEAIAGWEQIPSWRQDLDLVCRHGASLVSYQDEAYPSLLHELEDFPPLLYVKGRLPEGPTVGVVGTRRPTLYGQEMALSLSKGLAHHQMVVVSGLARGIDALAHRGALEAGGLTVAVLGSGLACVYPPENRSLAQAIEKQGAVVSELPMATRPDRPHFPARNRIVSGMSLGTLLVEAPAKSGAMITMDLAQNQGRKCFTIPGRLDLESFRGNHLLVKQQRAVLIEGPEEVAARLNPTPVSVTQPVSPTPPLSREESELLKSLPQEELNIDEICHRTKVPIAKLGVLLMGLVLKRVIKEYPGKLYRKSV